MNSKVFRQLGLSICAALMISGCSGKEESEALERAVVIARENVVSIALQSAGDKTIFEPGENWDFAVIATRKDGSTFDATSRVDWRSSDTAVAQIKGGKFTAAQVSGALPVSISASWAQFSSSLEVSVSDAVLVSITASLADPGPVNECLPANAGAIGNYSDGSTRPLTGLAWNSSAPDVARVDAAGMIMTLNAGASDITASRGEVVSEPVPLSVSDTLAGIAVSGEADGAGSVRVQVAGATRLVATGTWSDGTPAQAITPAVSWKSSHQAAVKVDAEGSLGGIAPGSAEITAACGGLEGTISATAVGIDGVVIVNPRSGNLVAGDRIELELYGMSGGERGTKDLADDGSSNITWQIPQGEGDTLATIDTDGFLEINKLTNIVSLTAVKVNVQYIQGAQTFNSTLLIQVGPTR